MLPDFANLTVERYRGVESAADSHGNTEIDWTNPDVVEIRGCWIGQAAGAELRDARQTVILDQRWWGPPDADVLETDRLKDVESGITYEVNGPVVLLKGPDVAGTLSHKTCPIRVIIDA